MKSISFPKKLILAASIFLAVITLVGIQENIKHTFEYDPDEGTQLTKALLLSKGFSLYKEIWDDQPPLLTVLISYYFKLFGASVYNTRILILIFSGLLLTTFYLSVMRLSGVLCALTAAIFLFLSTYYLQLSVSVMAGIPCLAFAMCAIYCAILYNKLYLKRLLILSAAFMAFSLQTKLFTVFLIPLILAYIMFTPNFNPAAEKRQYPSRAVIFWLAGFCSVFFTIAIIFFHFNIGLFYEQLLQPHLKGLIPAKKGLTVISRLLLTDYDIILLALNSMILVFRQKNMRFYIPFLWLISIFPILLVHRPIWYHYYLLISIPLCWLAAISFSQFIRKDMRQNWFDRKNFSIWLMGSLVALTIIRSPVKYNRMIESIKGETTTEERRLIALLSENCKDGRWIVTDRSIFAFYAGLLIPPELSLISNKRILLKNFSAGYLKPILQKYKPKLLLLGRLKDYETKILSCIDNDYAMIYHGKFYKRSWIPFYLRRVNKIISIGRRFLHLKLPVVSGGHTYVSAGKDMKLYMRKPE